MDDLVDSGKNVDYLNSPESTPPGAENFSINEQRAKSFNGGSNGSPDGGRSSKRLKVFELSRFDIKKPEVEGFDKVPQSPCVIATTHLSDIDVQEVVTVVRGERKVGVASHETNLTAPMFAPFVKAIGKENFFPITNSYSGGILGSSLRAEDIEGMKKGIIEDKRTMIVAAHNPTSDWKLPDHPGMAAVILAHKAKVPLVPVALDIDSKTPVAQSRDIQTRIKNFVTFRRPHAKLSFAEPMEMADISEENLNAAMKLYSLEERRAMSQEQIKDAQDTLNTLKGEADRMMYALAEKLPPEKRGKWDRQKTA